MGQLSHEQLVLRYLFGRSGLTRSEIAEQLGIRKNTIGTVCSSLLAQGKIVEQDPARKRNSRVMLNPAGFLALGIEHQPGSLKVAVVDAGLRQVARLETPLAGTEDQVRVQRIVDAVRKAIPSGGGRDLVVGVGFSDFVPHNIGAGFRMKSVWMPGWGDIDIKSHLERETGLPVSTLRFTDAFAVAEHMIGSCRDDEPFCVVMVDQGIGLSVFRNGAFLKGSTDIFGEIGHTVSSDRGEICKCGNRGCLEVVAGTGAIVRKVQENIEKGFFFRTHGATPEVSFEDIVVNAAEGNKLALLVVNEATKAIGNSIANMVNVLGIMRIVLYGELARVGDPLLQQVQSAIRAHCIYPLNQNTKVTISSLDAYASAAGAALHVLCNSFGRCPADMDSYVVTESPR